MKTKSAVRTAYDLYRPDDYTDESYAAFHSGFTCSLHLVERLTRDATKFNLLTVRELVRKMITHAMEDRL